MFDVSVRIFRCLVCSNLFLQCVCMFISVYFLCTFLFSPVCKFACTFCWTFAILACLFVTCVSFCCFQLFKSMICIVPCFRYQCSRQMFILYIFDNMNPWVHEMRTVKMVQLSHLHINVSTYGPFDTWTLKHE